MVMTMVPMMVSVSVLVMVMAFAVALVEACGHRHLSAVKLPVLSQWLLP